MYHSAKNKKDVMVT